MVYDTARVLGFLFVLFYVSCPETNEVRVRGNVPHVKKNYICFATRQTAKSAYKIVAKLVQNRDDWLVCFNIIGGKLPAQIGGRYLLLSIKACRVGVFSSGTLFELRFT